MARTYDNSLRERQAQETREAIVEAAFRLLVRENDDALTFARVAAEAGVSEPTVYRNFGTRDALLQAVTAHVDGQMRGPTMPQSLDDLPAAALATFEYLDENRDVVRAAVRTRGIARDVREAKRRERRKVVRNLVAEAAGHLPPREAQAVEALFLLLVRADTYVELTDGLGLDGAQAGEVLAWALRALVDRLERESARGARELVSQKVRARARELRGPSGAGGRKRS